MTHEEQTAWDEHLQRWQASQEDVVLDDLGAHNISHEQAVEACSQADIPLPEIFCIAHSTNSRGYEYRLKRPREG